MPERRYRAKGLTSITEVGFLFDAVDGESYSLNPTGVCIMRALLADRDSREIWSEVAAQFAVDPANARRDVDAFLARLHAHNLVVLAD